MSGTFDLNEAGDPRVVKMTIPAAVDPYFVDFFMENKKQGETPEQFLLRIVGALVANYYAQKKVKLQEEDNKGKMQIIRNDLSTFTIQNNLNDG